MAPRRGRTAKGSLQMIVSDEQRPRVEVKPGTKLQVVSTRLTGPDLRRITNIGARLCGGTSTCLALVDIGSDVINPAPRGRSRRGR